MIGNTLVLESLGWHERMYITAREYNFIICYAMLEQGKRHAGNSSLIERLELFESLWPMLPSKLESKSIDNPMVESKENEAIGHLAYSLDIKGPRRMQGQITCWTMQKVCHVQLQQKASLNCRKHEKRVVHQRPPRLYPKDACPRWFVCAATK